MTFDVKIDLVVESKLLSEEALSEMLYDFVDAMNTQDLNVTFSNVSVDPQE